jgi:xylulose-5-phosphate/fructose-6-phosphate phosphoketolase
LARGELPVGRADLSAGQSAARKPLKLEHIKPRLLGHWGTTPGLNFLYVHLNRLIKENDLNMIYVIGPGHGGPGIVAHTYLEGSYTERYPAIERSRNGLQRLFPPVLLALRHSQPRRAGNAGLDP